MFSDALEASNSVIINATCLQYSGIIVYCHISVINSLFSVHYTQKCSRCIIRLVFFCTFYHQCELQPEGHLTSAACVPP